MTIYCEAEKQELAKFKSVLAQKQAELAEINAQIRVIQDKRAAPTGARERATALLEGKEVSGSLKDLQSQAETLTTVVATLQQAVAEQTEHLRQTLYRTSYREYPIHKKVVEAEAAFDQAMRLIEKGIELDKQAVQDLQESGLSMATPATTNRLFDKDLHQLRQRWLVGDLSNFPAALR